MPNAPTKPPPQPSPAVPSSSKRSAKGPRALPLKKAAKAPRPKPDKRSEVDLNNLPAAELAKRCKRIYELEKARDIARERHVAAKKTPAAYKRKLDEAQEALDQEIEEQRFGPGPLFDPSGTKPAGK